MNCSNCDLTYTKQRKPVVFPCGHSFCCQCVPLGQNSSCFNCSLSGKPNINYAILEHIIKKNTNNIDKYIKICLFGNMDVGKSSILKRLVDDQFQYKTNPTIGIDFKYIDKEIKGKNYRFQIWDSAGQQRYRAVSSNHLKGSDIILLVYDLSMKPDQNGLSYWIKQILNYSEHSNIILVGNKTDLVKDKGLDHLKCMTKQEQQIINTKKLEHIKISCLDRNNVDNLWGALIKMSIMAKGVTGEQKKKSVILGQKNRQTRPSLRVSEARKKQTKPDSGKGCC